MIGGVWIPVPDDLAARLDALPVARRGLLARRRAFEAAVHAALDAEGWPNGGRGEIPIPCTYWFVNLRRRGEPIGHVGPLPSKDDADRVARSWRSTGTRAFVSRTAIGACLTNRFEGP